MSQKEKRNNIEELQETLFETMRQLREGKIKTDEARCVSQIAKEIINSANTQIKFFEVTGQQQKLTFFTDQKALPGKE